MTHPSASDSFATLTLYKFIYLLTYLPRINSQWNHTRLNKFITIQLYFHWHSSNSCYLPRIGHVDFCLPPDIASRKVVNSLYKSRLRPQTVVAQNYDYKVDKSFVQQWTGALNNEKLGLKAKSNLNKPKQQAFSHIIPLLQFDARMIYLQPAELQLSAELVNHLGGRWLTLSSLQSGKASW